LSPKTFLGGIPCPAPSNMQQIIKEKDSHIKELMDNMARERFVVFFLEQENN